jgi:hypothetical protein
MKRIRVIVSFLLSLLVCSSPLVHFEAIAATKPTPFLQLPNSIHTSSETTSKLSLTISLPDELQVLPQKEGLVFLLPNCSYTCDPGKPLLPVFTEKIAIDYDNRPSYIRTQQVEAKKVSLPHDAVVCAPPVQTFFLVEDFRKEHDLEGDIDPSNTILAMNENETINASVSVFDFQNVYPSINVKHAIENSAQGRFLVLHVNPVYLYQGSVYAITKIHIEIGLQATDEEDRPDKKTNSSLILTPDELLPQAKELLKMHQEDGFDTSIVRVSDVQSYPVAENPSISLGFADAPADIRESVESYDEILAGRIRSMLREKLQEDAVDYVTIFGDATYIPPSYYEFSPDMLDAIDQWIPTDIYYASPFYDEELTFEISVGRLPVQNKEEAQQQIEKIRRYRQVVQNKDGWENSVALFSGDPFRGDFFGELAQCRAINEDVFNGFSIQKNFQTSRLFNRDVFLDTLENQPQTFLWNMGHGSGTAFMLEKDAVKGSELENLPTKNQLPVFVSEACGNGSWDTRFTTPAEVPYTKSFSEAVLASPGAGIAYVGGARVNYASYNVTEEKCIQKVSMLGFMDKIVEDFFLTTKEYPDLYLGDWTLKALEQYYVEDYSASMWLHPAHIKTLFGFTLLGDPTLSIPLPEKSESYTVPEVDITEGLYDSIYDTILSIDQEALCTIQTDSPTIQYVYASLDQTQNDIYETSEISQTQNQMIEMPLNFLQKGYATIRFSTNDDKEKRAVFDGRYEYDLSLQESYDVTLLRDSEQRAHYVEVVNEGIHTIRHAKIDIVSSTGDSVSKTFPFVNRDSMESIYFEYNFPSVGEYSIETTIRDIQGEKYIADNERTTTCRVLDEPIYRIGILSSQMYYPSFAEALLSVEKLNQKFADENQNIELQVVEYMKDPKGRISYNLLGFDALVLFESFWIPGNANQMIQELETFVQNGGKILGIHSTIPGNETMNMKFTSLQTFFGIQPDVLVAQGYAEETETDFLMDSDSKTYHIENEYMLVPKADEEGAQIWTSSHLQENCKVIGTSSQKGLSLIQKDDNIFFFTGLLYNRYFTETSDTFQLFHDLLSSLFAPGHKTTITFVEKKGANSIIAAHTPSTWMVEVQNHGNIPTPAIWLQIEQEEKVSLGVLQGHQRIGYEILLKSKEIGPCSHNLSIWSDDQKEGPIDQYTLRYIAHKPHPSKEDLSLSIHQYELGTTLYALGEHLHIAGTAYPSSTLRIGDHAYPVDSKGDFQVRITPEDAPQRLRCFVEFDDVQGDPLDIPIQWLDQNEVYFHIGSNLIISQGESVKIDSPPVIVNGRTVVPISTIANCFGASIEWHAKTQTIQMQYMNRSISLQIGNKDAIKVVQGVEETISMDTPPIIINGRTMVPLRFIADCFSAETEWEGSSQVITLRAYRSNDIEPAFEKTESELPSSSEKEEVFTAKAEIPSYVLSCQEYEESLFVATKYGIHQYKNGEEILCSAYPKEFKNQSLPYDPEKFSFAVHEDYFFVPTNEGIYRIHRETQQLSLFLPKEEKDLLLVAKEHYYRIDAMIVVEDLLYILCPRYGMIVYNVHTQEYLYTIGLDYGTSITYLHPYVVASTRFDTIAVYDVSEKTLHMCQLENLYENFKVVFQDEKTLALYDLYDENEWISIPFQQIKSKDSIDMEEWEDIFSFSRFRGTLSYIASGLSHYGVVVNSVGGLLDFTTEIVQVDFEKEEVSSVLEEDISDCKRIRNWIPNPKNVRIVSKPSRLICTQNTPGNQDVVFYVEEERVVRHTLKTTKNPYFSRSLGYAWGDDSYSVLNLDVDFEDEELLLYLLLDVTDFSKDKPDHKGPYKVRIENGDFSIASYAFSDEYLVINDTFKNSLLWFNFSSGSLENRQYCLPQEQKDIPLSISNLTMVGDVLYFLDPVGKAIYSSTCSDGFVKVLDLSVFTTSLQMSNLVVDEGRFYFYDSVTNAIMKCNEQRIVETIPLESMGLSSITSFDIEGTKILHYDSSIGIVTRDSLVSDEQTVASEEDIFFSTEDLTIEFYAGQEQTISTGLYVKKPFDSLQVVTDDQELQIGEVQQKQSQILTFTIAPSEEKTIQLKVVVDGIEKVLPLHLKQKKLFVTLFDQSIFAHTWKGVLWSKNPCFIQEKQQFCWVDVVFMEQLFSCEIYTKEDLYCLSFDDILLEAHPNEDWYVYQNAQGQRYRREGALFHKNVTGDVFIEPTLYATYKKGSIQRKGNSVTISGL